MMIALLVAAAAAAASPHPGALKTFKDWTVGCDNGRACQAVALMPDGGMDTAATMALKRGAAAGAVPEIWITSDAERVTAIAADGKQLAVRLIDSSGELRVAPGDAATLVAVLPNAQRIDLLDRTGNAVATVSSAGASAALRYMDDQQKRGGTVTALVARGPVIAVPPPPAVPVIVRPATPKLPPARYRTADLRRYAGTNECKVDAKMFSPEAYRLDAMHTLVLVPSLCGNGAYNYFATALIVGNVIGAPAIARFDAITGMEAAESAYASLVNASWDESKRLLSTLNKGRGLGDCGTTQSFAWDGARFRLVEQTEMNECRGSIDYITTWRATVR